MIITITNQVDIVVTISIETITLKVMIKMIIIIEHIDIKNIGIEIRIDIVEAKETEMKINPANIIDTMTHIIIEFLTGKKTDIEIGIGIEKEIEIDIGKGTIKNLVKINIQIINLEIIIQMLKMNINIMTIKNTKEDIMIMLIIDNLENLEATAKKNLAILI